LDEQTSDWTSQPEIRQRALFGVQVLVNRAHVGELQAPAKLNAEKAEAHVPDLPEAQAWFLHHRSSVKTATDLFGKVTFSFPFVTLVSLLTLNRS
jgi:hypothetical protein